MPNNNFSLSDNKRFIEPEEEFNGIKNKDTLRFKKGQYIFFEGSSPQGIYLIESGKVKVCKSTGNGKDFITYIASKGDILSYCDLYFKTQHTCSGVAIEETIIHFIHKKDLQEALKKHPQIFELFLEKMVLHIRYLETKATNMAYKPVRGRLADTLLSLAYKFEIPAKEIYDISITRVDLASLIGTARETVNRLLSELRQEGIISTQGTTISIIKINALDKISKMYE